MPTPSNRPGSSVIPSVKYRNAPAAIDWLCDVFGFERHLVVPGPGGTVAHAQLRLGNGMLMLGSVNDNEYGKLIKQPDEIGGFETRSDYLVVPDADAVYARARKAGATIVLDLVDQPHGGRAFTCRDLEGRLWTVGTYDPWAGTDAS